MKNNIKVYIPFSDRYLNCVEILKYSIDKYWDKNLDVTIVGYSNPHIDLGNWKFVSLGVDNGPNQFSKDMHNFFSNIEDEFFIYWNEDWPLIKPVNLELLDILIDCLDESVGRLGLTRDIEIRHTPTSNIGYVDFKNINNYNIIELKQDANYRNSLLCSIWNRKYFLSKLSDMVYNLISQEESIKIYGQVYDDTAWGFEMIQSDRAINDGYKILGSSGNYSVNLCHLYHRGQLKSDWNIDPYTGNTLNQEDYDVIKNILKV